MSKLSQLNFVHMNLDIDMNLTSEKKLLSTRTKALIYNLKKCKKVQMIVLHKCPKRYMKAINSKFANLHRFIRIAYVKQGNMIFIREG